LEGEKKMRCKRKLWKIRWKSGLFSVALALSLLILAACARGGAEEEPGPLVASGTIRATEIRLASEQGGKVLEIRPTVGERVEAGDALIQLDPTPLELQYGPAEAAVRTAEADLQLVKAGPRPQEVAAAEASLALAEAERDGAYEAWQNALDAVENPRELDAEIISARTQVELAAQGAERAEADAEAAQARLAWDPFSYEAKLQAQAAQAALEAARADERAAQALLNQLYALRREPLGLIAQANAAEGTYLLAQAGVTAARARLDDLLLGPTDEEVAVAEAALKQARAEAAILEVQLERTTLTSPIDGVVLSQVLHEGELATPSAPVLILADLSHLVLAVYVPENRVGEVRLGQPVEVTVDSFPERTFEGQVKHIADEPEFTPRNVATAEERLNTFYAVKINLPNASGLLKPGMPADATFEEGP
jgi:HlyD family secretion protein